MPTTYLAPSLQDQGYTGATGTTPFKPATTQQVDALQGLYKNSPAANAPQVVSTKATVININFDGTKNNGQFPAPGESPTNISQLTDLHIKANGEKNTIYLPGVGAQTVPTGTLDANGNPALGSSPSSWDSIPFNAGDVANRIVEDAYKRLSNRVESLLAENPNAEISLNLSGFSRGGAEAVAFANYVNERGIPGLYEAGQVPIDSMVLFDPVDQTNGQLNTAPPTNVKSTLVMVAGNEGRAIMAAMPVGGDATVVLVPGAHADVGGSFNPDGVSAVTLKMARDFQEQSGVPVAEIPDSLAPNWEQMNVHNSGLDNYGNTVWSFNENYRGYEGAGVGAPSVQDVIRNGVPYVPSAENPAAGDALDYKVPADLSQPDGPQLTVREVTDRNGNSTLTVMNAEGHVVMTAAPGDALVRDPGTGQFTLTNGVDGQTRTYTPEAAIPEMPADKGVQLADASGALPDTFADTSAHASTNTFSNYLEAQGNALSPAQQTALATQIDNLNLGGEGDLSFYTLPNGSALIANADGEIVGEINRSESGDLNLRATGIDANGNTVEVNNHITPEGQNLSRGQYNAQVQQQATALFNSLMAANNWDHLSDVGKLSTLVNLYNATDKLGEAFNATGDNLPGDLGAAAGYLQLAQGLQSGDNLIIVNGINVVSDRALDSALSNAMGSTAEGAAVPYLSYALAMRNFADNPEQAVLTAAGTYVGESIGMAMGGPIGAAIGGMIGGSLGGALGLGDDPPPPPVGLVHFGWNANGEIIPLVDVDQSGGASAATSVANQLLEGLNQLIAQRNHAIDQALSAQGVDPAVYASFHVSVNASTLPSVQWDQQSGALIGYPDGFAWSSAANFFSFAERHFCVQPEWAVDIEKFQSIAQHADVNPDDVANISDRLDAELDGTSQITLDRSGNPAVQRLSDGLGGQVAEMYAQEILNQSQIQVDLLNRKIDHSLSLEGVPEAQWDQYHVALNPAKLPEIKFDGERAYFLSYSNEGAEQLQTINLNRFAEQLQEKLTEIGSIQPSWEYETIREHWIHTQSFIHEQQLQGVDTTAIEANARMQLRANAIYGDASESADFESQTYGALLVHAQGEIAATIELLKDVDGDGYLEKTQTFAGKDFSGNSQALLVLDFNGDGLIETRDILNLGGNTNTDNPTDEARLASANADQQRNNVQWLDANGDGVLDKSDPAFAAIRLWADINQDGSQQGNEASSLSNQHISSINFKTGEVTYEDGHTDALTAQTLKADTEGVKFTQIQEVNPDGTLHALDAGTVLEHEGYQGKVQITDEGGTRWASVREQTYEQQAKRTGDWEGTAEQEAHRHGGGNVDGAPTETTATGATDFGSVKTHANVITQSTLEQGSARVVSDAPTSAPQPKANAQTTVAAGDSRLTSNASAAATTAANSASNANSAATPAASARIGFVPTTQASVQSEIKTVTASMIESSQSMLFGGGSASLGVLAAVGTGATASAASAAEVAQLRSSDANTNSAAVTNSVSSNNTFSTTAITTSNGSADTNTPAVTFKQVDLGVVYVPPVVPSSTPTTAPQNTATPTAASTHSEPTATTFVQATVIVSAPVSAPTPATVAASKTTVTATTAPVSEVTPDKTVQAMSAAASAPSLDYPVVQAETLPGTEDVVLRLNQSVLLANDSTPNANADPTQPALTITAVSAPLHGQVSLVDGEVLFAPDTNFHGTASFMYTVTDQYGLSTDGTATLVIAAVNDAPVTQGETSATAEDTAIVFTQAELLANDSDVDVATDGQVLSISRVGNAQHGTVVLDAQGQVRFTPDLNYHGPAQFTYWVSDGAAATGAGAETPTTVDLTIAAVNDAPVVQGEAVATNEDTPLLIAATTLLANDSDVDTATDGQMLSLSAVSAIAGQTHGSVSLVTQADGTQQVQFTPDANYHGTAKFNYTVSDGHGGFTTAVATVNLAAVNDAPVTQGETKTTDEDTAIVFRQAELLANDSDVDVATDGQVLSISAVSGATKGTVTILANGDIRFVPNANYHGPAEFTYTVSDGNGGTTVAKVNLTISAVNDAPVVQGEAVATNEDTPLLIAATTLLANDSDVDTATDGQVLSISAVSAIAGQTHGSVSLVTQADGTQQVQFTPDANYHGTAKFNYTVSDGNGGFTANTATVNLAAVNDAPVTKGETKTTDEDTAIVFTQAELLANDSDVDVATDDQVLRISAVNGASNGTVTMLANGDIRFVPNANYHGPAEFTYTVSDGNGGTTDAKVNLTLTAVNDAPVAVGDVFTAAEDTTTVLTAKDLLGNDTDNDIATDSDVLTITRVFAPQHCTATLNADGTISLTPEANYHGSVRFSYEITDAQGATSTAFVVAGVNAVNDAPVSNADSFSSLEDHIVTLNQADLLGNDADNDMTTDGDELHVARVSNATNGQVRLLANGQIEFVPDNNFHGVATFDYVVSDSFGATSLSTVTLQVGTVNDAPVVLNETASSTEDTLYATTATALLGNDSDVDTATDEQVLSVTQVQNAQHGVVSMGVNGRITFTPDANFHGAASFEYVVSDGTGVDALRTGTVTLNVSAVNDAPLTQGETKTIDEDTTIVFTQAELLANDSDVDVATDGQVLSISAVSGASNGTVTMLANGDIRFVPNANYHGPAEFTYTVSDGSGGTTDAKVNLTVTAVNDAPVVQGEAVATNEDTPFYIQAADLLANDSDVDAATDGQVLSLSAVSAIAGQTHGSVSLITQPDGTQQVQFTPDANYHGTAKFNYTVSDGNGGFTTNTATVNMAAVNDAPVSQGESYASDEDVGLIFMQAQLLANDSDADTATDGQVLRISAVNGASNGTVTMLANGDIRFVPNANYHGPAEFTYTVSDGNGGTTDAKVNLTITAVNDAPVVQGEAVATNEDTPLLIAATTLLANDSDVDTATDGQVLSISAVSAIAGQTHGSVSLVTQADGIQQVQFTPDANYHGTAKFNYTVSDGHGGFTTAVATVNLTAGNDAPVTQDESYASDEDTGLIFTQAQLLANDSDVDTATDGQVLSISRVGQAEHGTVWLDTQGNLRFVPEANYHGPAKFTYWVSDGLAADGAGAETPATMSLTIASVNDIPVVQGESTDTTEDTTLLIDAATLLVNDSDVDVATDGQVLSISALSNATHCTVSLVTQADGKQQITFVPAANFHGAATFDYMVSDGKGGMAIATAVVNLSAVNDTSVTTGETATGDEDNTLIFASSDLLANDADVDVVTDNQVLTISRVGNATHGTVSLDAQGQVHFTPEANYHGPAQFTYWVSDGLAADGAGAETPATVTLSLLAVNDLPVITGETVNTNEDTTLLFNPATLLANDSDVDVATDNQVLNISAVSNATHGTVALVTQPDGSQQIRFTPEANYFGMASYQYTVSDGNGGNTLGTVVVNLAQVNDTPAAADDSLSGTTEDTALHISFASLLGNDTDVDSHNAQWVGVDDVLTVSAVGNATHGTVVIVNGEVVFNPEANYHGAASFAYQVTDSRGAVSQALATFSVAPMNDAPVAVGETVSLNEDTTLVISQAALLASDSDVDTATDGQVLSITAVSNAQHGTVILNVDGSISFVPEANYYGNASFDYTVSDGNGGETTTTATIALANVNDAPVVTGETVYGSEDQVLTITASALLINDSDIDNAQTDLRISRVQSGAGGTVSLNASGNVVFTPTANYNGTANFTYWVKDPSGQESNAVTTKVVLAAVNDAPSAQGEIVTGASEDAVFNINKATLLVNEQDIDDPGSALSLSWVGNATGGSVSLDVSGNVVFTPTANFNGNATFQYKVRDAAGLESAVVQAVISVAAVNDAPVAVDDQFTTYKNSTMTIAFTQITGNDTDVDGDALTVSAVRNHANGHAEIVNGQVQFVVNAGFVGAASFDYLADDGHGGQAWATAYVDVKPPPNQYPTMRLKNFAVVDGRFGYDPGVSTIYTNGSQTFSLHDDGPVSAISVKFLSASFSSPYPRSTSTTTDASRLAINWDSANGIFSWNASALTWDISGIPKPEWDGTVAQITIQWELTDSQGLKNICTYKFNPYNDYEIVPFPDNESAASYFALRSGQASVRNPYVYGAHAYSYVKNEHSGYFTPPVILDLNGDGVHFTSIQNSNVTMDVNFDGIQDKMAWAGNDDGVLVWDKDQNHQITDVSEFGFQTLKAGAQTDLEGLQALDTNGNGLLDAGDAKFAEFAVWQDTNGNGVTDAGEFKTLTELGIASINLHSDGQMRDAGTLLANSGSGETDATVMGNAAFTRTDGSTGVVADTMLAYELGHAEPETPADAQAAEIMRQALLFNQVCNTAVAKSNTPLGFVPIEPDVQLHDMLVMPQDGSHQLTHSA